jgi:hypothetical protein
MQSKINRLFDGDGGPALVARKPLVQQGLGRLELRAAGALERNGRLGILRGLDAIARKAHDDARFDVGHDFATRDALILGLCHLYLISTK